MIGVLREWQIGDVKNVDIFDEAIIFSCWERIVDIAQNAEFFYEQAYTMP